MELTKEFYVEKCMGYMCEKLPSVMLSKGRFKPYWIYFIYPGTKHQAGLLVECDTKDLSLRRLVTRAVKAGTDLCVSNYMECGTMDEIIAYLSDKSHIEPLAESIQELVERVDDFD